MNRQITDIMNWFNFNKVWKVMEHLNWGWANTGGEVPSVSQIRDHAQKLLEHVDEDFESNGWIACGGFKAEKVEGRLALYFIVEMWDNFDTDIELS